MRKIRLIQGLVNMMKCDRFRDQMTLDKAQWPSQGPGVRADSQWEHHTWLEELVSKSNTIQTQEDISVSGKIAGNIRVKLCIYL